MHRKKKFVMKLVLFPILAIVFFLLVSFLPKIYTRPFSIVIDTDIGQDIDDSWALALALKSHKELNIKLVLTAAHNTNGRAQITAKYLESVGRTDIPIGIGEYQDSYVGPLYDWAKDYDLKKYPGILYTDGVQALNDILMDNNTSEDIYILELAPLGNMEKLIDRFPKAVSRIKGIFAMAGSINYCYDMRKGHCPEYNVRENVDASKAFFSAPWKIDATPLDTCGSPKLTGDLYQKLLAGNKTSNPILYTLLDNYCYWAARKNELNETNKFDCTRSSSILFDPTATFMSIIYPKYSSHDLSMQELPIIVDDKGNTIVDSKHGKTVNVALDWIKDGQQNFEEWIVNTLLS